jgi:hypothetical protein
MLNRTVSKNEAPWLNSDLPKGKIVYRYAGATYGCIGWNGVAVSDKPDSTPFYEVPASAVTW